MKPTTVNRVSKLCTALGISTVLLIVASPGAAAAADVPILGEFPAPVWVYVVLGVAAAAALALLGVGFFRSWPVIGAAPFAVAIVAILAVSAFNPGGGINDWGGAGAQAATALPGAATVALSWSPALYMDTSDLTVNFRDAADNAVITPSAFSLYAGGVDERKALEGSGSTYPVASATPSSGRATLSVNTRSVGCTVDAVLELANYYDSPIHRSIGYDESGICRTVNANDNTAVTLPDIRMQKIGTMALSGNGGAGATLTCAAASTCTYQMTVTNTAEKTYIRSPGVKFTNVDSATLNSVTGACMLEELSSGAQWITFEDSEIGPLEALTCQLSVTRTAGDTDGSFTLTGDDLLNEYGAKGPNAHANINDMAATAAKTVAFA